MIQQKRFGRKLELTSTVQIVRELKIMMRRDAEAVAAAGVPSGPGSAAAAAAEPSFLVAR